MINHLLESISEYDRRNKKDRVWTDGDIRLILHRAKDHNPPHLHAVSRQGEILYIPERTVGVNKMCRVCIPRILENQKKTGDIEPEELIFYNCDVTRDVGLRIWRIFNLKESKNKFQNWRNMKSVWRYFYNNNNITYEFTENRFSLDRDY